MTMLYYRMSVLEHLTFHLDCQSNQVPNMFPYDVFVILFFAIVDVSYQKSVEDCNSLTRNRTLMLFPNRICQLQMHREDRVSVGNENGLTNQFF